MWQWPAACQGSSQYVWGQACKPFNYYYFLSWSDGSLCWLDVSSRGARVKLSESSPVASLCVARISIYITSRGREWRAQQTISIINNMLAEASLPGHSNALWDTAGINRLQIDKLSAFPSVIHWQTASDSNCILPIGQAAGRCSCMCIPCSHVKAVEMCRAFECCHFEFL